VTLVNFSSIDASLNGSQYDADEIAVPRVVSFAMPMLNSLPIPFTDIAIVL